MQALLAIFAIGVLVLTVNGDDICKNSVDGYTFPSEKGCEYFYICVNKTSQDRLCALDLHFNPSKLYCQSQKNAGCKLGEKLPDCKNLNDGETFPKPDDCGKFYLCSNKVALEKSCKLGLHYNAKQKYCEDKKLAGCKDGKPTVDPPTVDPPTIDPPTEKPPSISELCKNQELGKKIPYPNVCTKFITCIGGGVVENCPSELHFNAKLQVCDWRESANCPWW